MSNIEYIKNVTAYNSFNEFSSKAGEFSFQLSSMPDLMPDEAIIRGINFNGPELGAAGICLLWSNLNNDFVGSFRLRKESFISPQSIIKFTSPIPNHLEFKLYSPIGLNKTRIVEELEGDIVIHIDFIKYKRV